MKPMRIMSTTAVIMLLGVGLPAYASQDKQDKPQQQEQPAKPEKQQTKPQQKEQAPPQEKEQHQQQQKQTQPAQAEKQQQQHEQQQAKSQQDQQKQHQQQNDNAAKQQQVKSQQDQQQKQQHAQGNSGNQQQAKSQQQQGSAQQYHPQNVKMQTQQQQHQQQGEQRDVWQQHRATNWQSEHRDWQQRGGYNGYRIPQDHYNSYFGPSHSFRIYSYPVMIVGGYPRFQYGGFWFSMMDPWPEYWSSDWYDNDDVYVDYSGDGYYMYNRRYPNDRIAITVYVN